MSTLKKKRAAYGAAFGIVLFFLIGITLQLNSQPLQQYARAQTPTIIFNPNQKQTTFFETPPPDTPVPTAVPIPTNKPASKSQPIPPTSKANSSLPIPTTGSAPVNQPTNFSLPEPTVVTGGGGNICAPNQQVASGCSCDLSSGSPLPNHLCDAPPNDHGTTKILYVQEYANGHVADVYVSTEYPNIFGTNIKDLSSSEYQSAISQPSCVTSCLNFDKPVIYIYPEKPTYVSVKLDIPGSVTKSIPTYPDGGWQNVLAYPNGQLEYNGKSYPNLFYETNVGDLVPGAKRGEFIRRAELQADLDNLITKFGLIGAEKTEFLEYWVPRLQQIEKPYFLARPLTLTEKNIVDTVIIQPKPDTFIHLLIQFYPSDSVYPVEKIRYPTSIPVRRGFTAVEWGGAVMNEGL